MSAQTKWRSDSLPDSDITVLMRVKDDDANGLPLWPGFYDGEMWREASGGAMAEGAVIGWMHLDEAAKKLDTNCTN